MSLTDIRGGGQTDNTGGEVRVTQLLYHFSETGTFWAERGIFYASSRPTPKAITAAKHRYLEHPSVNLS
ncbi:hypothetical protein [Microcoleus sp. CAWBG58]|uniref:hypothetical protein n=1 Tax=Microcoleus sp. CAWBG58 TaxID=2841651 RepID=UPI0025CC5CC6|nr:hypothetical protein [Microcoleus sp. CAWBG58]